jgi:hypothetical protein
MRRLLLFMVLANLTGWPQTKGKFYFTSGQANGLLWATMDDANKISFVVGMNSGGEVLEDWALWELPVCVYKIKKSHYPPITNKDQAKEIDTFYETATNVPLPISVPVLLTYMRLNGATPEQVERFRALALKTYIQ